MPYFLGILPSLVLLVAWHARNRGYPHVDEAEYVVHAQRIAGESAKGTWALLVAAYQMRLWKPVLHPLLLVPGLLVSGGYVRWPIALTAGGLGLVALAYVYLLARERLELRRAALVTAFVGTLPWVLGNFYHFTAEISAMACSVAVVWHLRKADGFACRRHALISAALLGVGLCMRPFELGVVFLGPVAAELVRARWPLRRTDTITLASFIGLALFCPLSWYFHSIAGLIDWAYKCTYGDLARNTGQSSSLSQFSYLARVGGGLGGMPFVLLGLMAFGSGIRWPARGHRIDFFLRVILPLALPIVIGATTYNEYVRYFYPGGLLFYAGVVSWFLSEGARTARVRKSRCVACLIALQFAFSGVLTAGVFPGAMPKVSYLFHGCRYLGEPVRRDPTVALFERVREELRRLPPRLPNELLALRISSAEKIRPWLADAHALNIMSQEKKLALEFLQPAGLSEPNMLLLVADPVEYRHRPGFDSSKATSLVSFELKALDGVPEKFEVLGFRRLN